MKIRIEGRLAFVEVSLIHQNQVLHLERVLLDTGSAASVFATDEVEKLGLKPDSTDRIHRLIGIGGVEYVVSKKLDTLTLGELELNSPTIQIGAMQYGFPIQGLIGLDFLLRSQALIDLGKLEVRPS